MATIAQHIAARDDHDLQTRLVAAAEQCGVSDPARRVAENLGALVCVDIDTGEGVSSLADVHAYAVADKGEPSLSAGADPAYITDEQVKSAVTAVLG